MSSGDSNLPVRGKSRDGIYPRCVWCDGENYALAVLAYSHGEIACAAAHSCGRFLPEEYVTLKVDDEEDDMSPIIIGGGPPKDSDKKDEKKEKTP